MRRTLWPLLGLCGCAFISAPELDAAIDADGDSFGFESDCAPTTRTIYPGAPDVRGDGCDADCGAEPDEDGDDWPDAVDCGPTDPNRYPCAPGDADGDDVDVDCDGLDSARFGSCDNQPEGADAPRFAATCLNAVAPGVAGPSGAEGPPGDPGEAGPEGPEGAPGDPAYAVVSSACQLLPSSPKVAYDEVSCDAGSVAVSGGVAVFTDAACTKATSASVRFSGLSPTNDGWIGAVVATNPRSTYGLVRVICARPN